MLSVKARQQRQDANRLQLSKFFADWFNAVDSFNRIFVYINEFLIAINRLRRFCLMLSLY